MTVSNGNTAAEQNGGMTQRVRPPGLTWVRSYVKRLFVTDLVVIVIVVFGSQFIRFGPGGWIPKLSDTTTMLSADLGYTMDSVIIVVSWMLSLDFFDTRNYKFVGTSSAEYKHIIDATIRIFGILAIVAYLTQTHIGRGYVLVALPAGLILLILARWRWRQWLAEKREGGTYMYRALLVGQRLNAEHVVDSIQRAHSTGLAVIGVVTKGAVVGRDLVGGVPVLGEFGDIMRVVDEAGIDTLILTGADDIGPIDLRRLGWDLEDRHVNLIVAPALTDIAGPRVHARPVAGLPLIYVEFPAFEGRKHKVKRGFDIVASIILLVLLSPVLLGIIIAVRLSSAGPVLFRQERVGLNGRVFRMIKFRSMVTDAEDLLPSLLDQSDGNGVLFKLKADPRVTTVGRFLRKYSLDELPQLFNVLGGSMSLVGPRPHPVSDVMRYQTIDRRRLLVQPGLTGLWQVSGRSLLSWEESVRLDLYYVENWTLTGDLVILWRTIKAVLRSDGAY